MVLANSIESMLVFTVDGEWKYENRFVPMLDIQVKSVTVTREDCTVYRNLEYRYYEKSVTSNKVLMAQSAINDRCKIGTLSQEFLRRLEHC